MRMAWLNGISLLSVLKMKFSVPESTASSFTILSPELIKEFIVLMMGNPAPTFVSKRNFTPAFRAVSFSRR